MTTLMGPLLQLAALHAAISVAVNGVELPLKPGEALRLLAIDAAITVLIGLAQEALGALLRAGATRLEISRGQKAPLPLIEALGWKPGTVIDLGVGPEDEVALATSGQVVAHGSMGRRRSGAAAVRISRTTFEEEGFIP